MVRFWFDRSLTQNTFDGSLKVAILLRLVDMRKKIKKPMTQYGALRLLINNQTLCQTIKHIILYVKLLSNPPVGGQAFKLFKYRKGGVPNYAIIQ